MQFFNQEEWNLLKRCYLLLLFQKIYMEKKRNYLSFINPLASATKLSLFVDLNKKTNPILKKNPKPTNPKS